MVKDYRGIDLASMQEIYKLEKFIEEICDYHNINNEYFGNILLASTEAVNILFALSPGETSKPLSVNFEKTIKGFLFKIAFKGFNSDLNEDQLLLVGNRKKKLAKELYIVNALADEIEISYNGDSIRLTFYVSSMNYEKSLERIKELKDYWNKKSIEVKRGN
jgi:hypothetical protein